jgi:cobalamin biosynthetic protein CobC
MLSKSSEVTLMHGGRRIAASRRYGIPANEWLDLSTGVSPYAYPVPPIPPTAWQCLPEDEDDLLEAALDYYGVSDLCVAAGSQSIIQVLPRLRSGTSRVAVPSPGYAEHANAWSSLGHSVTSYDESSDPIEVSRTVDVLIVINPNNPSATRTGYSVLEECRREVVARNGWLIVDEAFIDPTPEESVMQHIGAPGLIVLRSLGKFFGLAGARVGFGAGEPTLCEELSALLGPWPVSGPARYVATLALRDRTWQTQTRARLAEQSERLSCLLFTNGLQPRGGCSLFQWVVDSRAAHVYDSLAAQGVLIRLFTQPLSLRFGVPGCAHDFARLSDALACACLEAGV